jgi:hypothetical protein
MSDLTAPEPGCLEGRNEALYIFGRNVRVILREKIKREIYDYEDSNKCYQSAETSLLVAQDYQDTPLSWRLREMNAQPKEENNNSQAICT